MRVYPHIYRQFFEYSGYLRIKVQVHPQIYPHFYLLAPNPRQTPGAAVGFTRSSPRKHIKPTANSRRRRGFYQEFAPKTPQTHGKLPAAPWVLPGVQHKNTPNPRQTPGAAAGLTRSSPRKHPKPTANSRGRRGFYQAFVSECSSALLSLLCCDKDQKHASKFILICYSMQMSDSW